VDLHGAVNTYQLTISSRTFKWYLIKHVKCTCDGVLTFSCHRHRQSCKMPLNIVIEASNCACINTQKYSVVTYGNCFELDCSQVQCYGLVAEVTVDLIFSETNTVMTLGCMNSYGSHWQCSLVIKRSVINVLPLIKWLS
jgi:hypothetical protein